MFTRRVMATVALAGALGAGACQTKSKKELAPIATTVEPAEAATKQAREVRVEPGDSIVSLEMKAPLENIYGIVENATTGSLFIDPSNLEKTTGVIEVDLRQLVLTHQKRDTETAAFGEPKRQDLQNEHAKTWLEIADDTPEEQRKRNAIVTFRITKVAGLSSRDVTKLEGNKREVTATVTGDFVLHQRQVTKTARMKVVFDYAGDQPTDVQMTTVEPFIVDLEQHDVRPRKAFGVLADATLATLGNKVDKQPKISLELRAKFVSK